MSIAARFPTITRDEVFRLETRRMWLRWPQAHDAASLARWVGKPSVALQTSTFPVGADAAFLAQKIADMRARNQNGTSLGFVMVLKSSAGEAIGMAGAHFRDTGMVEMGYHLDPALWGQGLMTEAVTRISDAVFALAPVDEIVAGVRPDNLGSRRVLEKSGFIADGGYEHDSPIYGRTAVKRYKRPREKASPLVAAMERHALYPTDLAFDLRGRV